MKTVFVGGETFDKYDVRRELKALPTGTMVVTGNGRGLEEWVAETAADMGLIVFIPPLKPEFFNYVEGYKSYKGPGPKKEGPKQEIDKQRVVNAAKDVQVNDLFIESLHNRLVLVGTGGRVKAVENILKMSNAWPVEVVRL